MNFGIVLFVLHDTVDFLVDKTLLSTNGTVGALSVALYMELGKSVVKTLRDHGITVRNEIDAILAVLPLVLSIVGVRSLTGGASRAAEADGIRVLTLADLEK